MARTDLTNAVSAPGTNSTVGVDFTFSATDTVNGNDVDHSGYIMVIANNTDGSARVLTIGSVADEMGRTGDIAFEVGAGEFSVFGPFRLPGWGQADGKLYIDSAHADLKVAIINI